MKNCANIRERQFLIQEKIKNWGEMAKSQCGVKSEESQSSTAAHGDVHLIEKLYHLKTENVLITILILKCWEIWPNFQRKIDFLPKKLLHST